MWCFLIDEDMPRSTALMLRQAGYEAEDVRDVGFADIVMQTSMPMPNNIMQLSFLVTKGSAIYAISLLAPMRG